jgi:lipopolysaccharide/colanic/teichoic acid biosynthesis glycosyltransferase
MTLKRVFDVVGSLGGLVLLWPMMLLVAVAIKLEDGGPVFYRGRRIGRFGRAFNMLKFRTMVVNAERIGPSSTGEDDPRITRVGGWLRRCKLDELPQLINVVRGEMSFVGPRPQVEWAVSLYTPDERALLDVRPGITDYASLMYHNEGEILKNSADPDRDYLVKIAPGKIRLGLEYVRRRSFWKDVQIILATVGLALGIDPSWCYPPEAKQPLDIQPS